MYATDNIPGFLHGGGMVLFFLGLTLGMARPWCCVRGTGVTAMAASGSEDVRDLTRPETSGCLIEVINRLPLLGTGISSYSDMSKVDIRE